MLFLPSGPKECCLVLSTSQRSKEEVETPLEITTPPLNPMGLAFFPSCFHTKCLPSKFHWWKIQCKEIGWKNRFWSDFLTFLEYKLWKKCILCRDTKARLKQFLESLTKCVLSACNGFLVCSMFFWQSDRKYFAANEMFFHKFQMILQKRSSRKHSENIK